jgi:hypothetical protein
MKATGKKETRNHKNRRTVQKGKKTHRKLVSGMIESDIRAGGRELEKR